ncbi:tyrosine-type recombinase/integrase [Weissella confusa]
MSVEKRNGSWRAVVTYYVEGKKKRKVKAGFRTKTEALAYETNLKAKLNDGYEIDKTTMLFTDFYDAWLNSHLESGIKQQTQLNHLATQKIVHEYLKNVTLEKMDRRRFQRFLDEYSIGHSTSTVRQVAMRAGMPLKEAFNDGIIKTDPTYGAKFKGSESKSSELKFLEESDLNKLLAYIEEQPITAPNFAIYTAALSGMRAGEVLALTLADINIAGHFISVTKTKTNRPPYQYTTPKTKRSVRQVAMPDKYFIQLERFVTAFPNAPEHIFGEKTTQSVPSHYLRKMVKELGIKPITLHGLRHTHASLLISKGIDVAYVSERLGHSNVTITQNTYFHLLANERQTEAQKALSLLN